MGDKSLIITNDENSLQQLALEKKLGKLDVDITSVVAAVFAGDKSLDERLAYFFTEGNKVPQLYADIGVSMILKEIYNEHDVLLSEKVKGLYGIKDASVYTFHFLINDLPRLYKDELIPTTLTHDAIDPSGIFVLMMGDVYSIKKHITASFNNYYRNNPDEEDSPLLTNYLSAFDANISEVANLFSSTQSNHVFKHLSKFAQQLKDMPTDDKGNILFGGAKEEDGASLEALQAVSENVNGMYSFLKEQTQGKLGDIETLIKSFIEKGEKEHNEEKGIETVQSFDEQKLLEQIRELFKSFGGELKPNKEEEMEFANDYILEPIVAAIKEELQKTSLSSPQDTSLDTPSSTSVEIDYEKIEASFYETIKKFFENSERGEANNTVDNTEQIVAKVSEQIASSHNRLKEFLLGEDEEGEMFRDFIASIVASKGSFPETEENPTIPSSVSIKDDDIKRITDALNGRFSEFGKNEGAVSREEFEALRKEQSVMTGKLDSLYSLVEKEVNESKALRDNFIQKQREENDAGQSKSKKDL